VSAPVVAPLLPYLQGIPDPRQASGRRHPLPAILALACAAMLAGCDSLLAIAEWGRDPQGGAPWAHRLGFTRARTPCVATLHRVFRRLDVVAFERAVGAWAAATSAAWPPADASVALAIDGKTLRGSRQPAVPAVQLLGALGHEVGVVWAQTAIDPGTDEVGALPALLADLVLTGRVVTLDAAFTERPVAESIVGQGGPI
jgi:DDE_Tnp_1-associated